jgi:hypothetical protein
MQFPHDHTATDLPSPGSSIQLAAMDTTVFVDTFAQGPLDEPVPVTSWREFQMLFGGFHATSEASYAVYLFFENGGEFAWVIRVADPASRGPALLGAGGQRQAAPSAIAESLLGSPHANTGIYSLRTLKRRKPGILAIPRAAEIGSEGARVYREAIALCRELGMLLLIDPPLLADSPAEIRTWVLDNPDLAVPEAALYYPRLLFPDALQHGRNRSFGPSGAVAGLLSWLDQEKGIWVSPAGLSAPLEAVTLSRDVVQEDIGSLNALGVNPIRDFPGHGIVLWGARTLGSPQTREPAKRYVSLQRFLLAIDRSLRGNLPVLLTPPYGQASWQQAQQAVESFFEGLWQKGALQGTRTQEAFYVRCDATTITHDDMNNGRLVVEYGLALVRPAEFVTQRIVLTPPLE